MRILIVDDHEIVRRGVRSLLAAEPDFEVCGEGLDGRHAIEKAKLLRPDVIVMDISMPNLNGLEAAREIRRVLPKAKILILSQHSLPQMIRQAFAAGADGYVVKSAISTELVAALRKVQNGDVMPVAHFAPTDATIDLQEILQRSIVFERALRQTGERLQLAQQVARIGTFELDLKTGANTWTPELEILYGLEPGTFPGTQSAWEQMIHPDDRLATLQKLVAAANGPGFESEWRVVWPDGSVHWLLGRASLFKDQAGNVERWVGVNIDITERKISEERAERLSHLLDLSFDAIVLRDANDCVRFWNRAAKDLYGWAAEEACGRVTHTLLDTAFAEPLETIFETLRKNGRWEGELDHCCKNGRRVTVLSRWALVSDWESGKLWVLETNTRISAETTTDQPRSRKRNASEGSQLPASS